MTTGAVPGLVSTIVPVYNRPFMLREAVASVLAQTWPTIEVIIVDDGSTDETGAECDRLASEHATVRVIHQAHAGRIGLAREAGRLAARGEFLQYLDSDDLLAPTKFAMMVQALRDRPECDIAYCFTRRYRRGEAPVDVPTEQTGVTFDRMLPGLLERRAWHTSTPLYRRTLTDRVGPWTDLDFWEDIEYDVRVATRDPRLHHCREFLTDYRDHGSMRASELDVYGDPRRLADAGRAITMIHGHLIDHGLAEDDPDLGFALDDAAMIGQMCRDIGFDASADRCEALLRSARGLAADAPVPPPVLAAELRSDLARLATHPGEVVSLPIHVRNCSTVAFRANDFGFELGARILDAEGNHLDSLYRSTSFSPTLHPGELQTVTLDVRSPRTPGEYTILIDVLWNSAVWLGERGGEAITVSLACGVEPVTRRWSLAVHPPARAALESAEGTADRLAVSIEEIAGGSPWHVQANTTLGPVRAGETYAVRFRARAGTDRAIGVGLAMAHAPWDNLGGYHDLAVSAEWREFALHFEADTTDRLARLHFDLGAHADLVEIAAFSVTGPHPVAGDDHAPAPALPAAVAGSRKRPRERVLGILMYHAVIDEPLPIADWCFLRGSTFRRQLELLRQQVDLVPLEGAQQALREPGSGRPLVAITLDDGFLNNRTVALPHLQALGVPATVFVTSGLLDGTDTVWFCRLHQALTRTRLERVTWNGQRFELTTPAARGTASRILQERLKSYPGEALLEEMRALVAALGEDPDAPIPPESPYRMLDRAAIADLLRSGLVSLGGHTASHAILAPLARDVQRHEIAASLGAVRELTGAPARLFAYPNGRQRDYNRITTDLLMELGVETCVTAVQGLNRIDTPPLELQRHLIGARSPDDDLARFLEALEEAS